MGLGRSTFVNAMDRRTGAERVVVPDAQRAPVQHGTAGVRAGAGKRQRAGAGLGQNPTAVEDGGRRDIEVLDIDEGTAGLDLHTLQTGTAG